MKQHLLHWCSSTILFLILAFQSIGQCGLGGSPSATAISNGNCLNSQSLSFSDGGFIGGCNGGSNPYNLYQFTAPAGCVDFDITNITGNGLNTSWQYRIFTTACALTSAGCIENVDNGTGFTITADNVSGTYQLTAGTTYYLQLMGDVSGTNYTICMSNNVEASNDCAGALGLGTANTTYYNGSAGCAFSGTQTGGTGDPTAATMCAGSLENTQWVNFSPLAGTTSFQVVGTGISCSGGACAYQFGIFSSPTACGTLTPEGCVSNGLGCGPGPDPNAANPAPAGTTATYTMAWSGVSATGFTGTISIASGSFTGAEEFYLVMDGNAGSSCTYTLQGINVVPLPIHLVYFRAKQLNNANILQFEVASQIDNDYFTIERSIDGTHWDVVTTIDGAGDSQEQTRYAFTDMSFSRAINYYRLKQTDFNGDFKYSEILSVDNRLSDKDVIGIYDLNGKVVDRNTSGLILILYSDGTSEKIVNP